jgi:NAD+ diphosphatase
MILFLGGEVLTHPDTGEILSPSPDSIPPRLVESGPFEIGVREGARYFAATLAAPPEEDTPSGEVVPISLRQLAGLVDEAFFTLVSRARQLLYWGDTYRICPRCGDSLSAMPLDFGKECMSCGLHLFPPVSPAIIVGVVREDTLLLAHNVRFPGDIHSLVAGFVEPGETIEECARREVLEETSILIGGIRYFGSQTWPFPHSLMIGLTAEYAGGEIDVDGVEIDRAGWFRREDLPTLPGKGSISRKIIDWFREAGGIEERDA